MRLTGSSAWNVILGLSIVITYLFLHLYYDLFKLPYFWDELGVYSRAAMHMNGHGIGILPSALPDELSRGHPILIPFIFACGFKLFGCNVVVAKLIAATIYAVGIIYIFRIFLLIFKPKHSFIFSYLIFIQPCFLSESVLILPEIPLMVAGIIAFYYYIREKYLFVSIALITALFIKESAVILPLAFFLIDFLINRFRLKHFIYLMILPFSFIIAFFAIQYMQRGYVFYPLHTSLVKLELYYINERYRDFSKFVFWGQGREFLWFYLPILFTLFYIIKSYKIPLKSYNWTLDVKSMKFRIFISVIIIFLAGLSFTSLNYFLSRYTLYFLVFAYVAFFMLFFNVIRWNFLHYLSVATLLFIAFFYNNGKVYTDVNFSYINHIKSCEKAMAYLNVEENTEKTVAMDFPFSVGTWDNKSGYFDQLHFKTSSPGDTSEMKSDFYVFTSPGNIDDTMKFKSHLILLKKIESGYAYVNIYQPKKK